MTKMIRRRTTIAAALAAPMLARHGWAQSAGAYPAGKTVRIVVPFAAGGTTDILGRIVAQLLTEQMGGTFVVDNKTGAGGNVGAELVAPSAPPSPTSISTRPCPTTA